MALAGILVLDGGTGTNTLTVDDSSNTTPASLALTATQISGFGGPITYGHFATLSLKLSATDTFTGSQINPGTVTNIDGGIADATISGDLVGTLHLTGLSGGSLSITGNLSGVLTVDASLTSLSVGGNLSGSLSTGTTLGALTVAGNLSGSVTTGGTVSSVSIIGDLSGAINITGTLTALTVSQNVTLVRHDHHDPFDRLRAG